MKARTTVYLGIVFSLLFTVAVWIVSRSFGDINLAPDQGASWYYWKLPYPSLVTRLSAWIPYMIHQVGFWWIIYTAQQQKAKYSDKLHNFNITALVWNSIFIIIHLFQSYLFYDGLAQDVSVWSSQGSVILMLIWIIFMLNNQRGIFLGRKVPFRQQVVEFAKKYHGYVFAWAIVYTFWYHPTEGTWGHLVGFFYMFMLLLQGSIFFTRMHINRYWMAFLETFVLFHGVTVAIVQGQEIWPMFLFGFWGAYILIYMWGLKLSKLAIRLNILVFAIAWIVIWSQNGFENSHQTLWVPVIYYLGVFLLYGLLFVLWKAKDSLIFSEKQKN